MSSLLVVLFVKTHLSIRHADLLHFIAQKERKCLELREQLAVHENELVDCEYFIMLAAVVDTHSSANSEAQMGAYSQPQHHNGRWQ